MKADLPPDELQRLDALRRCNVLDTPSEAVFDDLTTFAARMLQAPISLVSLVDETRQWFKSHFGLATRQTARELAFCAHAILTPDEIFEVPDTRADPRFSDNPLVTSAPHIRFYAGVPLTTSDGSALGTLNVMDRVARRLSEDQKDTLRALGRQVVAQLELRRHAHELRGKAEEHARAESALRAKYEQLLLQAEHSRLALVSAVDHERHIRNELQEVQRFREQVTQVMPSVLYVYDCVERRNVFVNREVATVLGHAETAMAGHPSDPVARYMHADDRSQFVQHIGRVMALPDGQVAEFTYRMRHADGTWHWFQSRDAVFARAPDRSVRQAVGTATDVSAIMSAEEALRASEERFRTLAELSPVGIGAANALGELIFSNACVGTITGLPVAACLGMGWLATLHPEDRERITAAWTGAVEKRGSFSEAFRFLHADGRLVSVIGEGRPLVCRHQDAASYVTTLVDVTVLKEVERHEVARAAAEQASRAKSEFVAHMSHELRTPLNAILGFAQLMQLDSELALDARKAEWVQQILDAGEHLLQLINETLDLAGIEAGRTAMAIVPIALAPLMAASLAVVEPLARQAEVALHNLIPAGVSWTVQADRTRLHEILLNLLSNAIKYNVRGGSVRVALRADGNHVVVSVEDSGIGLSESQLSCLFQPFNRLGAERGRVQGTGLGLVLAKRLAVLMNGDLWAQSQVGVGSVFKLRLPAS